jgi:type II secretory pathway pseudopilin PulG
MTPGPSRDSAREDGWTLIELLVAMTLMIVVLSATLTSFNGFTNRSALAANQNDTLDQARSSTEIVARQLRNLASAKPLPGVPSSFYALDYWTPYDLVFKSSDPQRRRVRYCLDTRNPANETVWQQLQAVVAPGDPDPALTTDMLASCPVAPGSGGWSSQRAVAQHVVNRVGAQDRPLFGYDQPEPKFPPPPPCPCAALPIPPTASSQFDTWGSEGSKVRSISLTLWIDINSASKAPAEASVVTAVFLRNQNQKPIPSFTGTAGGNHQVILNASGSSDPEGRTLEMNWYLGTGYTNCPASTTGANYMGSGITLTHAFPNSSDQTVTLEVIDPGGLCASLTKPVHPDGPTP